MMKILLLILFTLISAFFAFAQKNDSALGTKPNFDWLLKYHGKTTNSVIWDKRFPALLTSVTPQLKLDLGTRSKNRPELLKTIVQEMIGGPPEDVIADSDRRVILSGCRHQSCMEKAWLWCDTKNGVVIGVLVHYVFQGKYSETPSLLIFSRQLKDSKFPQQFKRDLTVWLIKNQITTRTIRFVNGAGSIKLQPFFL